MPIKDYDLEKMNAGTRVNKKFLTEEEIRAKHPTEYGLKERRAYLDYFSQIEKNEILLFNLPNSITSEA